MAVRNNIRSHRDRNHRLRKPTHACHDAGLNARLTPLVLGLWLVTFGAATFVTGWTAKWGVTTVVGIIWLFSAFHTVSYLDFAFLVGLPFTIYGPISKG